MSVSRRLAIRAAELWAAATGIAGGYAHSLALKADGTVVAWGWNDYGQTIVPAEATNVVAIAGGWVTVWR